MLNTPCHCHQPVATHTHTHTDKTDERVGLCHWHSAVEKKNTEMGFKFSPSCITCENMPYDYKYLNASECLYPAMCTCFWRCKLVCVGSGYVPVCVCILAVCVHTVSLAFQTST